MATAAKIREKALKKLGVKATGQTTQAEITADLDAAYVEVYAVLEALDIATWDSDEDIPDEMVVPVVALVAMSRTDEYSVPNDRLQRIAAGAAGAIPLIKELQASNTYKTPTAEYF